MFSKQNFRLKHIIHIWKAMTIRYNLAYQEKFSWQNGQLCLKHIIHIWKAMTLSYNLAYQETMLMHPTRREIFAGKTDSTFNNI